MYLFITLLSIKLDCQWYGKSWVQSNEQININFTENSQNFPQVLGKEPMNFEFFKKAHVNDLITWFFPGAI